MSDHNFLKKYFLDFKKLIQEERYIKDLISVKEVLKNTSLNNKKTMIFGNGGSAAIASHFSVDLTKMQK